MRTPTSPKDPNQVQKLREKAARLKARADLLEAHQREANRRLEDSKAFILGRFIQHQLKGGFAIPPIRTIEDLLRALDPYLTRDIDRLKFGLPPLGPRS